MFSNTTLRTDLAGLDAAQLVAKAKHPLTPALRAWTREAASAGGAGGRLVRVLSGSYTAPADLGAALDEVLAAHGSKLAALTRLRDFKVAKGLRHKDVWDHTLKVVLNCTEPDLVLRLAALLHDVGKPNTRSFAPSRGVTFDGHEVVGAKIARRLLTGLEYPDEVVSAVTRLVRLHLRPHQAADFTDAAVRRYVFDASPLLVSRLTRLSEADVTSKYEERRRAVFEKNELLRRRITEVVAADTEAAVRPPIDGNEVMARLGLAPGPEVGRYMRALNAAARDAFVRGEVFTEAEAWTLVETLRTA